MENIQKLPHLQLKVKIGSKNDKSIRLFESIGFVKVAEKPNYFGELELVFAEEFGLERIEMMLERWSVGSYEELEYVKGEER